MLFKRLNSVPNIHNSNNIYSIHIFFEGGGGIKVEVNILVRRSSMLYNRENSY